MYVPDELAALYDWIETNRLFVDTDNGRLGFLFPEDELKSGWTDSERPGGTSIEFAASGNANVHYWLGHNRAEVVDRLCVFAQTGAEGSEAALWIDDCGRQRIVHMGSGSGSVLSCVLADNALDFLRLIAIGYDEICWDDCFPFPPNHPDAGTELIVHPNTAFQNWLKTAFDVTIPATAMEIVRYRAKIGDKDSPDDFNRWAERNCG
jgi:hypothetical protein